MAEPYDVIIVGSGAGGGMSAYHLTKSGMKVLMLEAGRNHDPGHEPPMWHLPPRAPRLLAPGRAAAAFRDVLRARLGRHGHPGDPDARGGAAPAGRRDERAQH